MKIAIFHGTGGSPKGNWFPWVKENLESWHHTVSVPQLPTLDGQNLGAWIKAVEAQISDLNFYDVLIGHSCGASFLPHLITQRTLAPRHVIMVSAFSGPLGLPDYDVVNATFFLPPGILSQFRNHTNTHSVRITLLHGDNDPYVPIQQAKDIAKQLDAPLSIIKNGGHLNAESGYESFPVLLDLVHG